MSTKVINYTAITTGCNKIPQNSTTLFQSPWADSKIKEIKKVHICMIE